MRTVSPGSALPLSMLPSKTHGWRRNSGRSRAFAQANRFHGCCETCEAISCASVGAGVRASVSECAAYLPWPAPSNPAPGETMKSILTPFALATTAVLSACTGMQPAAPTAMYSQTALPDMVKVPPGHKVAMETVGIGEITYECREKQACCRPVRVGVRRPERRAERSCRQDAWQVLRSACDLGVEGQLEADWCATGRGVGRRRQHPAAACQSESGRRARAP